MLADSLKLKFKSSTQMFDEMLLQDIEPACLADLCYSSSQIVKVLFLIYTKIFLFDYIFTYAFPLGF